MRVAECQAELAYHGLNDEGKLPELRERVTKRSRQRSQACFVSGVSSSSSCRNTGERVPLLAMALMVSGHRG